MKDVSPEAHKEWADEEGKHKSAGIKGMGVKPQGNKVLQSGVSGANKLEAVGKANGKGPASSKSPFPKVSSGGPKTGTKVPQGSSLSIKGKGK